MKIIGIGGEPATGKTTLVRSLLQHYPYPQPFDYGLLTGTIYHEDDGNPGNLIVLGSYDGEQHDGTDTLAMNAITDAKQFITAATQHPQYTTYTLLFEGDRLYNGSFINYIARAHPSTNPTAYFPLLCTPQDELTQRHTDRGTVDTQTGSWLKGRQTKYANLLDDYTPDPTPDPLDPHSTPEQRTQLARYQTDLLTQPYIEQNSHIGIDAPAPHTTPGPILPYTHSTPEHTTALTSILHTAIKA